MPVRGTASLIRRTLLALLLVIVGQLPHAVANTAQLAWDPNTEADLAGYVLVYGTAPGVYTQSVSLAPTAVTHEVTGLADGTYYFAIRAFNAAGLQSGYSNEVAIVVGNGESPLPTIMSVSPTSGPIEGGTYVTITGTGFKPGAIVLFGSDAGVVTAQSDTSITAFTPAGEAGPVTITVSNPEGGGTDTRPGGFTYITTAVPVSEPAIAVISPANGPTSGGTVATISGSGFQAGAIVRFGSLTATVIDTSDTSIVVSTPAAAAGAVTVSITNPDGGAASRSSAFTYVATTVPVSEPTVTSVKPTSGTTGGGTPVTISGSEFQPGAIVLFGTRKATVTAQSPTSLTVLTPVATAGVVTLTVTNPDGGNTMMPAAYTYVAPVTPVTPPTVTDMTPTSGPTSGGTSVVLTGTGFQTGVVVRFGGIAALVLTRTPTALTVRAPTAVPGTVPVSVTNVDGGTAIAPAAFTYVTSEETEPAPTVSSFSPSSGLISGGALVTINGTDFRAGVIVRFGVLNGTVTSVLATRLVVRTPAQAEGRVALTVINIDGKGVQVPDAFTYRAPAPTISSLSPAKGPASGGTDVAINGTNFRPGARVSVNDVPATVVSVTSNRIMARMPAHVPAIVTATVTNADSQSASRVKAYTYVAGGPAVTQVLPASGPMSGGNIVSLIGSGFFNATVSLDGVNAPVVSRTATMVSIRVPAHGAGRVNLAVRNSDGLAITLPAAYTYEDPDAPFVRYFAEGASGSFFATRFALANPHAEPMPVTVTFTDTQGTPTTMEVVVPATSRFTIDESNRPVLASEAFATKFEAPRVIGVERTMTWAAGGLAYGAHSETGVTAPRTSWVLAEGATIGGFNTFYLLQNPTTTPAEVKVQYLLATGERIEKIHAVGPLSRTNIWVNKDDPALEAAEMSATLTSLNDVPVVVERSMYRNNGTELFSAGHNSTAVDTPALRWFLAEGATGGTFDEFVLIANPNTTDALLKVSYLRAGKAPLVKNYVAAAQSRLTIWVDQEHAELAKAEVSVVVESLTPTPIVVERAMWWRASAGGEWIEAHNSRGVTTTAPRWLVVDGEAGGAGQASTYVLVANTGSTAATVRFTLLTESGATRTIQDVVSANGRYSLDVAGAFPEAAQTRFSVLVESASGTAPLVVERASYSSTSTTPWAAGTNSLGVPLP